MIPDEIDGVGPAKSRPIGVWAYESLCWAALVVIPVIVAASLRLIRSYFGDLGGTLGHVWPACIVPISVWSRALVDAGLRRCGRAEIARLVEVWTQVGMASADSPATDEVVAVRANRDGEIIASVFCFAACVPSFALAATLLVNLVASPPSPDDRWSRIGYLLLASTVSACTGLAGVCSVRGWDGGPRYRADAGGIVGPGGKPFVPWAAVAAYRVTSHFEPTGRLRGRSHELIGDEGKPLLPLRLDSLRDGDDDRLIRFIQARFPQRLKDVRDGWDP